MALESEFNAEKRKTGSCGGLLFEIEPKPAVTVPFEKSKLPNGIFRRPFH